MFAMSCKVTSSSPHVCERMAYGGGLSPNSLSAKDFVLIKRMVMVCRWNTMQMRKGLRYRQLQRQLNTNPIAAQQKKTYYSLQRQNNKRQGHDPSSCTHFCDHDQAFNCIKMHLTIIAFRRIGDRLQMHKPQMKHVIQIDQARARLIAVGRTLGSRGLRPRQCRKVHTGLFKNRP